MMREIAGRRILITGASSGIGEALAQQAARAGADAPNDESPRAKAVVVQNVRPRLAETKNAQVRPAARAPREVGSSGIFKPRFGAPPRTEVTPRAYQDNICDRNNSPISRYSLQVLYI